LRQTGQANTSHNNKQAKVLFHTLSFSKLAADSHTEKYGVNEWEKEF
jgi:hypothetical protein